METQKQGWLLLVEPGWEANAELCPSARLAEQGRDELAGAGCLLGYKALQRISEY